MDGAQLRELRLRKGYSLKRLAREAHLSPSYLSEVERGVKRPSPRAWARLTEVLDGEAPVRFPGEPARVPLGSYLRRVRLQRGLSVESVAEAVGVPSPYLESLERCQVSPTFDVLEPLTRVLGIQVEELVGDRGQIGRKVRLLREFYGWSQAELAERAGLSAGFVGQVEQGKTLPSLNAIQRLAAALQCTPCSLIADDDDVQSVLFELPPEFRETLLHSQVREALRIISVMSDSEFQFLVRMLRLFRETGLAGPGAESAPGFGPAKQVVPPAPQASPSRPSPLRS